MKITFEQFMIQVDRLLVERCGLSSEDLPDQLWANFYEDGMSPFDAANCCLDYCNIYEELCA